MEALQGAIRERLDWDAEIPEPGERIESEPPSATVTQYVAVCGLTAVQGGCRRSNANALQSR